MSTADNNDLHADTGGGDNRLDAPLLRALQSLAVERSPQRELWPGIAARIGVPVDTGSVGATAALAPSLRRASRRPRRARMLQTVSACAALVLVAVLALPQSRLAPAGDRLSELLLRNAEALDREYAAAFVQLGEADVPAPLRPGLLALDAESARIRSALQQQPQQTRLLEQLKRTHERKLRLLRRGLELTA
ncbi:hypothetical protein [Aquimonas sp.]|jgi:hypothetical protein|uniref:hypothetical protein n=1 Tax=Aquimonas sp. TaxID=1872588 RepID=UPI0037BF6499